MPSHARRGPAGNIPIRVIPGRSELVMDAEGGDYHLNVGFHVSFNVRDLMAVMANLTDVTVDVPAPARADPAAAPAAPDPVAALRSAPLGRPLGRPLSPPPRNVREPEPTQNPEAQWVRIGINEPLPEPVEQPSDSTFDTPMSEMNKAIVDYRKKVSYNKCNPMCVCTETCMMRHQGPCIHDMD